MTGSMQETFVGDCSRFAAGRHSCTSSTRETSVGDFRHFTVGRAKSRCSSRRLLLATAPVCQRAAWHTCRAGGSLASSAMSAPHCDAASWLRRLSGAAAQTKAKSALAHSATRPLRRVSAPGLAKHWNSRMRRTPHKTAQALVRARNRGGLCGMRLRELC